MSLQHLNVKIYIKDGDKLDVESVNPVFQSWIRERKVPELLVDVASYLHVPKGPGLLLVGLEADYSIDDTLGRWGLRYNRKAKLEGTDEEILKQVFQSLLKAASLLQNDESLKGKIQFLNDEFELFVNDRALAPNTPETHQKLLPVFEKFLSQWWGEKNYSMTPETDPRQRFGIKVKLNQAEDWKTILAKLS